MNKFGQEMPVVRSCGPIRLCLLREDDDDEDDRIGVVCNCATSSLHN